MNEKGIKPQSSEEQSQKRNAIDIAKEHIQQLCEGFQQSPEKIAEYLTFAAQFYNYSARNTMLIYHKNPHAIFVSSRTKFQEMGFALKRGEYFKPTWILRPERKAFFQRGDEIVALKNATREERELLAQGTLETFTRTYFRPARVYELAQTDCPPEQYPKICGRGFSDAEHKALYERLKVAAELGGFSIEIHTLNSSSLSGYCIPEDIGMQKTKLATLMEHIQDDRIRNYVAPATCADQRTSLNIFSSALADLLKFVDAEMEQLLTGYSEELSAEKFINQPTIIYIICPDENPTRHFLASLFIRLFSNELIEFAEQPSNGGVLPRQVLYLADEFGNYPPIRDIEALFSALRSRRARLLISLQGDSQLRTKYDEQRAITIESNCMIFMFSALAPSASQTAKRISEMLGNETIMTGSKSISKGVTTTNTSLAGRPLLTPSQLVRLPWGQFIVQKTGYAPYIAHMRPYKDYLKLEAEQQVPPPSLRYSSVLSASAAMIEAVAKGHLYHLRKGMFDSEDSDW